jgi:hypothetical protein
MTISSLYDDVILAWDIMNEPELAKVPQGTLEPFLVACLEAVPEGHDRTIGWQHKQTAATWTKAAEKVTMPQFHFYPESLNDAELPKAAKGEILGEIATAIGSAPWRKLKPDTVEERLKKARDQGYEATFLWSATGTDQRTSWTDATRKSLCAFTGGTPCDVKVPQSP